MRHLLSTLFQVSQREFRTSHQNSIFRLLALAATGTGFYFTNNRDEDTKTRISVSFPSQLREPFSSAWPTMQDFYGVGQLFMLPSGHIPLNFARVASAPNLSKEATGEIGDSGKCGCECLGKDSLANAAALVGPAVVNLSVIQSFYGMTIGRSSSGTIIDSDGTILTCAHAVMDSSRSVYKGKVDVTLQDGRTFEGTVVNADFHSDIAVVKISSKTPLPSAKLGSSSKLRPGDWVLSVGCPLSLQNTVTAGIISCIDRKSSDLGLGGMQREYLQTDCPINSGNSGGPIVNLNGEVVGVNVLKVSAADGLGFAVPIDSASKIIEHFKKNGRVVRPWLGLKMLDLNDKVIAQLKERKADIPNVTKGVLVPMVTPGSPADRAGFHPGDIVIEFGGEPVGSIKEIIDRMGDDVGKPFNVVLKRGNNESVTLIVEPEEANPDM
ncbi:Serine protease htra1 [Thalictrum thalictroides]|uniref:Serine protease htra1 n=1 Tax=Thalictrum thalictroides TaxID=46969 RepID=A0A7J6VAI9_THATH|nr:Serine protease htra1 [Thalictrum thalictroides]